MNKSSDSLDEVPYYFLAKYEITLRLGVALFGFLSFISAFIALEPDESVDTGMTLVLWMSCVIFILLVIYCVRILLTAKYEFILSKAGIERRSRKDESRFLEWSDVSQVSRMLDCTIVSDGTRQIVIPYFIDSRDELLESIFSNLLPPQATLVLKSPLERFFLLLPIGLLLIMAVLGLFMVDMPLFFFSATFLLLALGGGVLSPYKIVRFEDHFAFHYLFHEQKISSGGIRRIERLKSKRKSDFDRIAITKKSGFVQHVYYYSAGMPRLMQFLGAELPGQLPKEDQRNSGDTVLNSKE
jgi:hypothetical protein